MRILGIETSCDETAAAIVRRDKNGHGYILSNIVLSQIQDHAPYGGVVPEIAARAHISVLDRIIQQALDEANLSFEQIDAIAATAGPGLVGGLIVGLTTAKAIALALNKPFLAINHLEGHALTARLTDHVPYPYLLLLVSGGHTQLILVHNLGNYQRLGTTVDDALGEAFDKTAKLLDLSYPGGPAVEQMAQKGIKGKISLPRPMKHLKQLNFSFSGLKTAIRQAAMKLAPLSEQDIADLCAAFQEAAIDSVSDRVARALLYFRETFPQQPHGSQKQYSFVISGGVGANKALRYALQQLCREHHFEFIAPPLELCTDNAAMIAWVGAEYHNLNLENTFDTPIRGRWPLDETSPPLIGSGKKGAKA